MQNIIMDTDVSGFVPLRRFERPTRGLGNRCSILLSYRGNRVGKFASCIKVQLLSPDTIHKVSRGVQLNAPTG